MSDTSNNPPGDGNQPGIRQSRIKFSLLVAIAFFPIMIAHVVFFYFPHLMPSATTNQGELIQPPVQGELVSGEFGQRETWTLMQLGGDGNCDETCQNLLYLSRQVVSGLGKDSSRLTRMVVTDNPLSEDFRNLLIDEHRDITIIEGDTAPLSSVTELAPVLFLMDPNGNIMMYYTEETAGKPMLKDLKHLMRVSNIG